MKLKGKVAIVTGGARDIGREVSLKLAKEGAKVVVNYFNSEEDARETKRLIEAANGECLLVRGDMTDDRDATNVVLIQTGYLWKYNPALGIYKCPGDRSTQQGGGTCRACGVSQWIARSVIRVRSVI